MGVIPAMAMPPLARMPAPLSGFRVLSLAEQLPGPLATMPLADLRADVILVERPAGGIVTEFTTGLSGSSAASCGRPCRSC